MRKILVLFAHPALQQSRVNVHLIERVRDLPHVTVRDLYERYPEMDIDVADEQKALRSHDIIVFHHPFFWYSVPPILKEWQDLVLEHGWAYGREGRALEGKWFFSALTTGGAQDAYRHDGHNNHTVQELLAPVIQTARLCRMRVLPPFVTHGTHAITSEETARTADRYRAVLQRLGDPARDPEDALSLQYLNDLSNEEAEDRHA